MKRLTTMLLLLLAVASATRAQIGYQPLVREGVRWIFCYSLLADGAISNFYAYEFRGDTTFMPEVFGSRYHYKKLYRYPVLNDTTYFDYKLKSNASQSCQYMQERNRKIYLLENFYIPNGGTAEEAVANEILLYDFSKPDSARVSAWGHLVSIPYLKTIEINGMPCRVYDSQFSWNDDWVIHNTTVEGIGYVGVDGDLLDPNPDGLLNTGMYSTYFSWMEDLEGNLLYYNDISEYLFYRNTLFRRSDISGDGRVDVADINAAVAAVMGIGENAKADVNGDGTIDIADINTIINVILNAP